MNVLLQAVAHDSESRRDRIVTMKIIAVFVCCAILLVPRPGPAQTSGPTETFDTARLTPEEIAEILGGVERSAYDIPESWRAELRVTRVNLGACAGIVLQGTDLLCGATGNCQVFVFRNTHGHWVSLFGDGQAPIGESFQFGPGMSSGIRDFSVLTNVSAQAGTRVTYVFDGRLYRRKARASR
jgi:hypothetical protein